MNDLHFFHNDEFGQVRGFLDDTGNPWFVAMDVCRALDLSNHRSSLALLDDDEKGVHTVDSLGGPQEMIVISEPGLYSLILRSRKPEAKAFKRWVTHEVIPSIRRTGQYTNCRDTRRQTEESVTVSIEVEGFVDLLAYVATLRQMARQKIYPDRMRMEFLAEAASLLSGYPAEKFLPPEPICLLFQ
jgi:prophage antirepressor-like protein